MFNKISQKIMIPSNINFNKSLKPKLFIQFLKEKSSSISPISPLPDFTLFIFFFLLIFISSLLNLLRQAALLFRKIFDLFFNLNFCFAYQNFIPFLIIIFLPPIPYLSYHLSSLSLYLPPIYIQLLFHSLL